MLLHDLSVKPIASQSLGLEGYYREKNKIHKYVWWRKMEVSGEMIQGPCGQGQSLAEHSSKPLMLAEGRLDDPY